MSKSSQFIVVFSNLIEAILFYYKAMLTFIVDFGQKNMIVAEGGDSCSHVAGRPRPRKSEAMRRLGALPRGKHPPVAEINNIV